MFKKEQVSANNTSAFADCADCAEFLTEISDEDAEKIRGGLTFTKTGTPVPASIVPQNNSTGLVFTKKGRP
jgi:hypothetical protein